MLTLALQLFYEVAYFFHPFRNVYFLRTMLAVWQAAACNASLALDAVVGLAFTLYCPVKTDEKFSAFIFVVRFRRVCSKALVHLHLVVVREDGGYVKTIGTWHAVLARVAGYGFLLYDVSGIDVGHFLVKKPHLFFREWL